ncbi:hypothetical protein C0J52_10086 [Blattella germanica]|nr:hypothetical protein C0J52_10086 [Blattella germanica]
MPCILIIHACCRLLNPNKRDVNWSEDSISETTNTCVVNLRRCTTVFAVQLILLFMVAGLVSMFVTNEQITRTVEQTPSFVHTALNDVTTFLHNSHQQIRFVITKSLDQVVDAASSDLDSEYVVITVIIIIIIIRRRRRRRRRIIYNFRI